MLRKYELICIRGLTCLHNDGRNSCCLVILVCVACLQARNENEGFFRL